MGAHGQTAGTSIRTPLKEERFPTEPGMTAGAQISHVLAGSAPGMMIWRGTRIIKLLCWALVPP